MDAGRLVGDDIMIGIVARAAGAAGRARGFVLDGFPRTVAQAEALDDDARRRGAAGRRGHRGAGGDAGRAAERRGGSAATCGRTAVAGLTACGKCGGALVQRRDDDVESCASGCGCTRATRSRSSSSTGAGRRSGRWTATRRRTRSRRTSPPRSRRWSGGAAVIVCRSAAEIERMRAANQFVADVLAELEAAVGAGRDDGGSRSAGGAAGARRRRRAGVQGLSRVSRDAVRVDQRGGRARDSVADAGAAARATSSRSTSA